MAVPAADGDDGGDGDNDCGDGSDDDDVDVVTFIIIHIVWHKYGGHRTAFGNLFTPFVASRDQTQVIRLGNMWLDLLLSHLIILPPFRF